MRTWMREEGDGICGLDARHILKRGDPVQVVVVSSSHYHIKRRLLRCALCADGEPPSDLEELPERML